MKRLTARKLALAGFFICASLITFALYLQYLQGIEPCPLCMFQRLCYYLLALIFLTAACHGAQRLGMRIYAGLAVLTTLIGGGFAMRHVWLQWYPPQLEACSADLLYQLKRFPFLSVVEKALRATGDCAKVDWTFLSLSIAQWSLLWFVVCAGLALWMFFQADASTH